MLFRPAHVSRPRARIPANKITSSNTHCRRQCFATAPRRREKVNQRYGPAQEPLPHFREEKEARESVENKAQDQPELKKSSPLPTQQKETVEAEAEEEEDDEPQATVPPSSLKQPTEAAQDSAPISSPPPSPLKTPDPKPLDTVLHMPSPAEEEHRKPPHLKTPPYVHHFDTYSLVKDLTASGFTQPQSVSVMKAVRDILTDNIALARQGLVSKSNVENETYLFRAACSELRTEIGASRKSEVERLRSERGQLQHEVDLLGQRLGQETGYLKDELKGLFDDRKMAVRQEQRIKETQVCSLPSTT